MFVCKVYGKNCKNTFQKYTKLKKMYKWMFVHEFTNKYASQTLILHKTRVKNNFYYYLALKYVYNLREGEFVMTS